jgi:YidC/Oxa1 family membrane protein insertase
VEKNLFLAIVLSMAVLLLWQVFVLPPVPSKKPPVPTIPEATTQVTPAVSPTEAGAQPVSPSVQATGPQTVSTDRSAERVVVIDTPIYRAELTNRGAGLRSFQLKRYALAPHDKKTVEMVPQIDDVYNYFAASSEANKAEILQSLPAEFENLWLPYSVRVPQLTADGFALGHAIHQMDPGPDHIELKGTESARVAFRIDLPSGLSLVKTLTFHAETYLTDVNLQIRNAGTSALELTPEMVVTEGYRSSGIRPSTQYDHSIPVYGAEGRRNLPDIPDVGVQKHAESPQLDWVAMEDLYFFSSLIPHGEARTLLVEKTKELHFLRLLLRFDSLRLEPAQTTSIDLLGYYGPKEGQRLTEIGYNLDRIIDYGRYVRFLALPAVELLKFIYRVTGSYGLAIIVLTFVLKLVTYPLTSAQVSSMEKMKALAPELEKIKAKFKDAKDPERYNQEMMGLYKRHGVNPAAGCLPILIQMPIFIALYSGLLYTIEMRHTAFLYIPDLSTPDPYYLSPLLMGATMLLQSRMSPAPPDPSQAMMMKVMPIMFTAMFLFAPAGLVIYWLMNNVLSMGQQYLMRKRTRKA